MPLLINPRIAHWGVNVTFPKYLWAT